MVFETRPTWDVRVMKFLSSGYFRGKAFENQAIQEGSDLRSQKPVEPMGAGGFLGGFAIWLPAGLMLRLTACARRRSWVGC
jgi:hypothetical protein